MRAPWIVLGIAWAPLVACGDGGTDNPSLGASAPSASSTTLPPASTSPSGDASPDGPTSNGGLARWSAGLGGTQTDVGFSIAGDAAGDVVVAGSFQGTASLGGVPMTSAGGNDVFVAKYSADGKPQWVRRFGGAGEDMATGVAIAPSGYVWMAGASSAAIDFGSGAEDGRGVAFDAKGDVFLSGGFSDTVDFGAGPATSHGAVDAYVVKLNPTGTAAWSQTFGGAGADEAFGVAADSAGEPLVGGLFEQTMMIGVTPFTSAGAHDVFALKFGADGSNVWSKHFGAAEDDEGVGVAHDGYGRALVTGFFRTQVDFGSGVQASAGDDDIFVATFDP